MILVTFETTFVIFSREKIYINKERKFERHISVENAKQCKKKVKVNGIYGLIYLFSFYVDDR